MFSLREYRPGDFDQLWALDQKCFPRDIAYSREELAYFLRRKAAVCLLAVEAEMVLGFILGHSNSRGHGHIITIDVDPASGRRGIGSTLIRALEERFVAAECRSVLLEVAVNNRAAMSFYKSHGYSVLRTLPRYYPGGLDALLMGKKLGDSTSGTAVQAALLPKSQRS